MRSQMKSFKEAEGCLVRFPHCGGGGVPAREEFAAIGTDGVLTGGLLCSTRGVSRAPCVKLVALNIINSRSKSNVV